MEPFASVSDYRRAYPDDETPDEVLLERLLDATDVICAAMDGGGVDYTDPTESFTYRLMRVCRDVTHRALGSDSSADIPFGATELSEGADTFSASVRLANPYGDMFLTQAEKDALGIGATLATVWSPYAPAPGSDEGGGP